jgi:two-component system, sensor histidine kinase YesM
MKKRIKSKIMFHVALIVSIALLSSGTYTYYYFSAILKKQVVNDEIVKLRQTARQIQYIQDDIHQFAQYIMVDSDIQTQIDFIYSSDTFDRLRNEVRLSTKLKNYLLFKDYMDSVVLVSREGEVISSNRSANSYYADTLNEKWYQDFLKRNVHSGFTEPHLLINQATKKDIISYIITFNPILDQSSKLNYLVINIDLNKFASIIPFNETQYEAYYLLDAQNTLLLGSENEGTSLPVLEILDRSGSHTFYQEETKGQFILVNQSMTDYWKLITVKSKRSVLQNIDFIFYFFTILTLASILTIVITLTPIIHNITRPISRLNNAMKRASMGRLNTRVSITSGDEIEQLGEGFNRMLNDLQTYMDQSMEDEKIKQKLQIDLLLSQINPHFIYNTLNTVIYMARQQGNHDIVVMMESFIRLLQETVMDTSDGYYVTVKEEVESVKHYLVIQNFRYPDRFHVNWELNETVMNEQIPRTILQPLVENALFHGIMPKPEKGNISICIYSSEQRIHIRVEDDGVGMDRDLIANIESGQKPRESHSRMRPIGLANVRERIRSFYGSNGEMKIDSTIGERTAISIQIPSNDSGFYTK